MKKWIWIGVVAVVAIFFYATYNGFVNREEGLKSAWSNVETQYQRRADLIPNLVNTVKGYAAHETQTLNEVTEARARAQKYKVDYVPESLVKVYVNHGHARLSAGFYQDKARRGILYHNHFLQTFSNVFDRYPERRLIHFEGLYNSNLILGNKKEAWHYYKLICKCKPSGTKRIKYLIKYLIK